EAADRGRILVTSRTPLPADRLAVLRVGPLDLAGGIELAARLPFLSRLDPAAQQEVVRSIGAHPRSLQLADAWLSANPAAALTPGARPVDLVIAELTGRQRETLLQAALLTAPFTVRDLAVACDAGDPEVKERPEPDREALDSTRADAARLAELGLLTRWETREEDTVHLVDRWIAEQLAPHQGPEVADRHERALNMHYSRTHAGGTFDDYVGVCRHLVAVQGMGDLTHFVLAVTESLEPSYEFAGMALLGEILPHVPGGNGHHRQIRDHLVFMLIRHGFADGASVVAERSLSAVAEWAATHPQRDEARFCLGGAYDTCGQARFAAGRLEEAEAVLAVAVDIYHELAAEHPMFMEADQRLAGSLQNLGEVYRALDLPEQRDRQYEIWSECTTIRTRLFQATTTPEAALDAGLAFSRLAELATRDGDLDNARKLLGTRRAMLEAMAEMHPYDPRLAAELEPAEPADDDDVLAILRRGPFAFNQWRADHAQQALDLSGTDLRGMNLDKMILAGANLAGANLSRASAREAIFSGADLTAANLAGADLTEAGFGYSEMVNATVAFTPLGRAMIQAATLTGAVFAGAILDGTSFRECDLTGVDLRGCDLSTLDLKRTSLEDAITDLA
ncbi:MAG: pentapeptide repeat-containing protein, partial [Nonomuraea sp.]|nr:pentapeptide repeat-containing protein [Nonomuraea sp.]